MRARLLGAGATIALLISAAGVASARAGQVGPRRTRVAHHHARAATPPATVVSVRLAYLGGNIKAPKGPYRARPSKLTLGVSSYPVGASSLWMNHLRWTDWGGPVAFATGTVHARAWPSKNFTTTEGAIVLDQLRTCGTSIRSYYTSASTFVPTGFTLNTTQPTNFTMSQALTPC